MNKRVILQPIIAATVLILFLGQGLGQGSSYLTQKLMLESDLRNRISDALSKVIDESRYVIDVSVILEMSDEIEEQVTMVSGDRGEFPDKAQPLLKGVTGQTEKATDQEKDKEQRRETMVGLPIPGFEFEVEPGPSGEKQKPEAGPEKETEVSEEPKTKKPEGKVLSRTSSVKRPSIARIKKQEISIILQEGAAPELIENIRQIVMVASRFNRSRGDVLSIMTASFKERRDEKSAEQVLLKTIANKIENLERKRTEEKVRSANWEEELKKYKEEEAKRREEDQLFFKSELAKLEMEAKTRAFQREKQEILRRDSLKLQALNEEIQKLKEMLTTAALPDSEAEKTVSAVQKKEAEKADLDAQIAQKIAMLESVQSDLDRLQADMNGTPTTTVVFLSLLGALLLVLLIVIVFLLVNRSKPTYTPPPPFMYPPRRVKRKKKRTSKEPVETAPVTPAPAATPPPAPAAPPPPTVEEDPAVLQSEINDIRKAVVSMSVGQPNTATSIVKEWMQEEAPPPPPEPETPAPETGTEEEGKKKKKKKK